MRHGLPFDLRTYQVSYTPAEKLAGVIADLVEKVGQTAAAIFALDNFTGGETIQEMYTLYRAELRRVRVHQLKSFEVQA